MPVHSPRALGVFALCAVILAAISFGAVDVSIANANGCIGLPSTCADEALPPLAVVCALIGTFALLASVLPAISWFISAIHHSSHDADIESMRLVRVPVDTASFDEEEL